MRFLPREQRQTLTIVRIGFGNRKADFVYLLTISSSIPYFKEHHAWLVALLLL